ncbi:MAG: hydrogenase maturation nickel metallochaperone HypA [Cyanobacteria bacterium REEB67]|nr:hydrogenase maturation nickel metallochaperone HypA [Cyanobacteria bacterium REEB67]
MHELSITQNIVAIVAEQAGEHKVLRVKLEIGERSAIVPDSIRFCFDVCSKGTIMEGALLEIDEIKAKGRCRHCRAEFPLNTLAAACPCGSREIECIAGEELKIKEMETE